MSIVLAITTDGRGEYLERTIDSIDHRLVGDITQRLIWDDSGDPEYYRWLAATFGPEGWLVISALSRRGHAQARAELWEWLDRDCSATHVAGWEDDFTLSRPVNLDDLTEVLDANPHLSQVALMRNACYPRELRTPDRILGWPRRQFRQHAMPGHTWYQHRLFWTCNPSLYPRTLCAEGWPPVESSEKVFSDRQVAQGRWSAFYGRIDDPPAIEHIGLQRAGGWY